MAQAQCLVLSQALVSCKTRVLCSACIVTYLWDFSGWHDDTWYCRCTSIRKQSRPLKIPYIENQKMCYDGWSYRKKGEGDGKMEYASYTMMVCVSFKMAQHQMVGKCIHSRWDIYVKSNQNDMIVSTTR